MAQVQGERFYVSLDDHVQDDPSQERITAQSSMVGDILERRPSSPKPPTAPSIKSSSTTGFPAHRKRVAQSRFKRQTKENASPSSKNSSLNEELKISNTTAQSDNFPSFEAADRVRIDQENRQKIASMTSEEIETERRELFSSLDPALIERLLRKANISEDEVSHSFYGTSDRAHLPETSNSTVKTVQFMEPSTDNPSDDPGIASPTMEATIEDGTVHLQDQEPTVASTANNVAAEIDVLENTVHVHDQEVTVSDQISDSSHRNSHGIHFPKPPQVPELDPSHPDFLEHLHEKYFPELAHDPSKLAWMQPASDDDKASPYHPSHTSLPATDLRFNFRGELLPPKLARQIPVSQGLHHHGDAPEAAGYTVPELAHLSRSTYAPQRCIAYQTLGRILYRLGSSGFGDEFDPDEDVASLSRGLWDVVEETKIVDGMAAEAQREKGHVSARAYAQEALWNWQRGGGRKKKAR